MASELISRDMMPILKEPAEAIAYLLENYESLFSAKGGRIRDDMERLWLENDQSLLHDGPSQGQGASGARRNVMVRWQCTIRCNYFCRYCFQKEERRRADHHCFDAHSVGKWVESFDRHFGAGERNVLLVLSGGEPTLDEENMPLLLEELCRRRYVRNVRIDTNASWSPTVFSGIEDKNKIWLNCSFHPDHVGLFEFLHRMDEYRSSGFNIGMVTFVLTESNRGHFERLRAGLDRDIPVNPNPLVDFAGEYNAATAGVFKQRLPPQDHRHKFEKVDPSGTLCLHPALAYQMSPSGTITVGCHEMRKGNFVMDAGLPALFETYTRCPKTRCDCSDMYSFQKGCSRNLDLNPLYSYKKALLGQYRQ